MKNVLAAAAIIFTATLGAYAVNQYKHGVRIETFKVYHQCLASPDAVIDCNQFNPYPIQNELN